MENRKRLEELIISNADYYEVEPKKVKKMSDDALIDLTIPRISTYSANKRFIAKEKVTEIKSGMYVKDAYENTFYKVNGPMYEDPYDYMIPTETGNYSPLLLE